MSGGVSVAEHLAAPPRAAPSPQALWGVPGLRCAGQYPGDPDPAARDEERRALLDVGLRCVIRRMAPDGRGRLVVVLLSLLWGVVWSAVCRVFF